MNTPAFIDDSSFNEVLFTLIGTAIVYADEGHDIEYPIFDYITSLSGFTIQQLVKYLNNAISV